MTEAYAQAVEEDPARQQQHLAVEYVFAPTPFPLREVKKGVIGDAELLKDNPRATEVKTIISILGRHPRAPPPWDVQQDAEWMCPLLELKAELLGSRRDEVDVVVIAAVDEDD